MIMTTNFRTLARSLAPCLVALLGQPVGAHAAFHMPIPVVRTLPNGMRVAVFRNSRLPIVQMELLVPGGVAAESADTPGAAAATARLLRAGTSSRTAEDFSADLDRLGGSIGAVAGRDYSTVDGTFLAADFDAGLELLADAVLNPIFPEPEVERYKSMAGNALTRLLQDPAALADAEVWSLTFAGQPYARPVLGRSETLSRLDRDAVQAYHRDFYRPDRAILAIAGDVDPERAFAAAADRFESWAGHSAAPTARPVAASATGPRLRILDRPGLTQSVVGIGLVGPARDSPDVLALQLGNYILGGGPESRLSRSLRQDGGFSYGAHSAYTLLRDAGLVSLSAVTRTDSVAAVVGRMRDELARLAAQAPGEAEVASARRYFLNSYPLQFQSLSALVSQWTALAFYGLSADSMDRYVESVAGVTADGVREAASRWLAPDRMAVVVVGPAASLQPSLASLGPVEVVTAETEPRPVVAAPASVSPEERKRGRELLAQTFVAHGGLARLRRVKDSTVNGDLIMVMGGNEVTLHMQQVRKEPLRLRFATRIASAENGQILDGARGWIFGSGMDSVRVAEADSVSVLAMQTAFRSDIVHVLLAAADTTVEVAWRGPGRLAGRDADLIEVTKVGGAAPAERSLLYLDSADHRLLGVDVGSPAARPGAYDVRRVYRDYRLVSGVLWPFEEERSIGGARTMTILVQSVVLNSGVSDRVFARPEAEDTRAPRR